MEVLLLAGYCRSIEWIPGWKLVSRIAAQEETNWKKENSTKASMEGV